MTAPGTIRAWAPREGLLLQSGPLDPSRPNASQLLPVLSGLWLESRVKEDEDGCWIWQGSITEAGQPQTRIDRRLFLVRRLVWGATHDAPLATARLAGTRCRKWGCVHPDCVLAQTLSEAHRRREPMPVLHRARISAGKRKLPLEVIERIRQSVGTLKTVGAAEGVHPSLVGLIRNGKVHRNYARPEAGLL